MLDACARVATVQLRCIIDRIVTLVLDDFTPRIALRCAHVLATLSWVFAHVSCVFTYMFVYAQGTRVGTSFSAQMARQQARGRWLVARQWWQRARPLLATLRGASFATASA